MTELSNQFPRKRVSRVMSDVRPAQRRPVSCSPECSRNFSEYQYEKPKQGSSLSSAVYPEGEIISREEFSRFFLESKSFENNVDGTSRADIEENFEGDRNFFDKSENFQEVNSSRLLSSEARMSEEIFPMIDEESSMETDNEYLLKPTSNKRTDSRWSDISRKFSSYWFSFASSIAFIPRAFGNRVFLSASVVSVVLVVSLSFGFGFFQRGMKVKEQVLGVSTDGYESLSHALDDVKNQNFESSSRFFQNAFVSFSSASSLFDEWNGTLVEVSRFFPFVSQLSSGKYLVEAGKAVSSAGDSLSRVGGSVFSLKNSIGEENAVSFLEVFRTMRGDVSDAERSLSQAKEYLDKVSLDDLPSDRRDSFVKLKGKLPMVISGMRVFLSHGDILSDILGGNGSRKFLFLFQNNQELRATGGFIGSYAFLDISDGRVKRFFVDGIFNPDGQLHEDIVPPAPIQKISSGWSLHDSNWFPDFPTSAEKAILFYEKTGGPTVDGVIAFTPEILKKLLTITGPITMEKYGVTIDESNFLETIQYQVEVAYDKEENKPKQILSDLVPVLLDRLFGEHVSASIYNSVLSAVESSLAEKQILFYSRNQGLQDLISSVGWSGEVLYSGLDYASVIHSNINGYKTDGVIEEKIFHRADIQDDGSVVDTITIQRIHRGGKTGYEWWDKVNADYMRVYVPEGSKLLSAKGYTREMVEPPLDYDALLFSRDPDVLREERGIRLDPVSGTKVYEDAGKTVFANWVYVSPGETVEVVYSYLLPFRVNPDSENPDSYSLVFQKQSGSKGSALLSEIHFPKQLHPIWQSEKSLIPLDGVFRIETDLVFDRFLGIVFSDDTRDY